mmetsp:Transcript_27840/g.54409  ORF Transcript_27840/g.54409 Transcript_27840/m.54409 type:complete len:245 (+) Transcript_27840:110-844(+)
MPQNILKKASDTKDLLPRNTKPLYTVALALHVDRELYARAVGYFYAVVSLLEDSVDRRKDKNVALKGVADLLGDLKLTEAFEQDLAALWGVTWRSKLQKNDAVNALCGRLQQVAEEEPVVLLSYAMEIYSLLFSLTWTRTPMHISHKYKYRSSVLLMNGVSHQRFTSAMNALTLSQEVADRVLEEAVRARDSVDDVSRSLAPHVGWLTVVKGLRSPLLIFCLAILFLSSAILLVLLGALLRSLK